MVLKSSSRLQLPGALQQGIPVQDERLKGVGVLAVAGHDRLRLRVARRRGQSGDVAVLLRLEGAQEEVLLPRGQLQSLVLPGVARPQPPDQERVPRSGFRRRQVVVLLPRVDQPAPALEPPRQKRVLAVAGWREIFKVLVWKLEFKLEVKGKILSQI